MDKVRVLYVSIFTFATNVNENGGTIYGKNLIQRLIEDDGIELFVLNVNEEAYRERTEEYFKRLGVELLYIVPNQFHQPRYRRLLNNPPLLGKVLFGFPFELEAHNQPHIAEAANMAVQRWKIDHVLFDCLPAILFWKDIERLPIPKTLVTVNREADLYNGSLAVEYYPRKIPLRRRISRWRLAQFERRMYWAFDKVIAIGAPDVPPYLPAARTAVITSYLDDRPDRWTYRGNKTVFFVGNILHYPNKLAINYIVSKLAPQVFKRMPAAKFVIIGASPDQIPAEYRHPSINLMGASTPSEVERLFKNADLFLCPVENTFGMKFKIAEAVAYGTPFLAAEQSMLGYPYLQDLPHLTLSDPDGSADTVTELLLHADRLKSLSDEIAQRQRAFATSQKNIWSRTMFPESIT